MLSPTGRLALSSGPTCSVSVSFVGYVSTPAPSPCERLSPSPSTMSWSDSQMVFGLPSFGRLRLPARAGTIWASQVLGVSLHTCHALSRPRQTLSNLTFGSCFVLASGTLTPSPSALLFLTGLYQASGSAVSLAACVIPCVRFNRFVRPLTSPPHGCNTRYDWLVRPYSTGTLTQLETPSFAWRTRVQTLVCDAREPQSKD